MKCDDGEKQGLGRVEWKQAEKKTYSRLPLQFPPRTQTPALPPRFAIRVRPVFLDSTIHPSINPNPVLSRLSFLHLCLCLCFLLIRPQLPQRQRGNRNLPIAHVVQVPVLYLATHRLRVVHDRTARLRAYEREAAGAEEEENT